MKKLTLKIITIVTAIVLFAGTLTGCGLFVTNTDRDMAQKVATVCVDDSKVNVENIYKRDLVAGYYSYGYYYVQQYSYTTSRVYSLIMDNLVNNAIVVQKAMIDMTGEDYKLERSAEELKSDLDEIKSKGFLALMATEEEIAAFSKTTKAKVGSEEYYNGLSDYIYNKYQNAQLSAKDAPFRFVSATTALNAVYSAISNVNSLVDSFIEDDSSDSHTHEHISTSYDVRTTPSKDTEDDTDEKLDVKELKLKEVDRVKAFRKGIARLKTLGLIDSEISVDTNNVVSILAVDYFKSSIISSIKSKIVDLYEGKIEEKNKLSDNELWAQYDTLRKNQENKLGGNLSDLETKLGEVSKDNYVLYNENLGYAYVSHILIGFTDEQKADVADTKELIAKYNASKKDDYNKSDIQVAVNEYVKANIVAKDQRETWVKSNYGTYNTDRSFTFDEKYIYSAKDYTVGDNIYNLSKYIGTIAAPSYHAEEENDDGKVQISLTFGKVTPKEFNYNEFCSLAAQVFGTTDMGVDVQGKIANFNDEAYGQIEDLKFAFSTDTGNLGKYLGYLYSPYTSKDNYVKAFAKACADVLNTEREDGNYGKGAYKMFASEEYGLHIVVCTELANEYGQYTQEEFIAALAADGDNFAKSFKKANEDMVKSTVITNLSTQISNEYAKSTKVVQKYNKAYSDLITEE